jgi:hypothetical protein
MIRIIRRALLAYEGWRHARRVRRRYPGIAATAEIARECRRKHKPVREVEKTLRTMVHTNLRRELGR